MDRLGYIASAQAGKVADEALTLTSFFNYMKKHQGR